MIVSLYRKFLPNKIRDFIYILFLGKVLWYCRNYKELIRGRWYYLYYSIITPQNDIQQALRAWGRRSPTPYPYLWAKEYDAQKYQVYIDDANKLPYTMHEGKKLYFRRDMTFSVEGAYRCLLIEQDIRSAHRYVHSYEELKGKTLLDVGAAEAIFALSVIEYVNHVYLFECDEAWVEALNATFEPWKEKVTLVRKYVSDIDDENNITLDTYFKEKSIANLFLKMDIEGYERKALQGATKLLTDGNNISGAVCIYHKRDDRKVIQEILDAKKLKTEIQPGFLYFENEMRNAIVHFTS